MKHLFLSVSLAPAVPAVMAPATQYSRTFSPREGERIVPVENLRFGEVRQSLFTVPADQPIRDIVLDTAHAGQAKISAN